jgi:hypothetical protein
MPIACGPLSFTPISTPIYPIITTRTTSDSPSTTDNITTIKVTNVSFIDNPTTCGTHS